MNIWVNGLKKVLNNECPNCESNISRKGILRLCHKCQLMIYGNPILIAYQITHNKEPYQLITKTHCPECNGTIFEDDFKHAVTVCK